MRLRSAYSRQGVFTGQSAQIRRATSTPTPSFGKNVAGGMSRHFPCCIHSVAIAPLSLTTKNDPAPWKVPRNGYGVGDVGGLTAQVASTLQKVERAREALRTEGDIVDDSTGRENDWTG